MDRFSENVAFIWAAADLFRGNHKQSEHGLAIIPLVVLRRLDQVLVPKWAAGPSGGRWCKSRW